MCRPARRWAACRWRSRWRSRWRAGGSQDARCSMRLSHLPLVLPPVVVGWLLLLLFGLHGPLGAWLYDWFGIRLVFTKAGAALACAVMILPLMLRAIRLSLEAVDPGLEQAARTLGRRRARPVRSRSRCRWPRRVYWWARSSASPPRWASSARSSRSRPTSPARRRHCRWRSTARSRCRAARRRRHDCRWCRWRWRWCSWSRRS